MNLRPYQQDVVAQVDLAIEAGPAKIVVVAPTGSGKTVVGAEVIRRAVARHKRVLVVAHRREIIMQTSRKLFANAVRHGIIMAGVDPRPMEAVQVASVQTLHARRCSRSHAVAVSRLDHHRRMPPRAGEHVPEHHRPLSGGSAARPERDPMSGRWPRARRHLYEIDRGPAGRRAGRQRHLVRSRVYAPVDPNLRGVTVRNGDYAENELADRMDKPQAGWRHHHALAQVRRAP